ncbi:unnamed protein product [Withania somnifera]
MYGMGFDHSFGLWFITRGAFKGHSTWVLRQAMPDTPIISLTPRHPEKYLKKGPAYVDENCTYFAGKDFVDFGNVAWGKVSKKHGIKDHSQVLVFFDDCQNELKRLKQALKAVFRHLVFEDNYDTEIWEKAVDIEELCVLGEASWGVRGQMLDNFNHSNKAISYAKHFKNTRFVESVLDVYWELPLWLVLH